MQIATRINDIIAAARQQGNAAPASQPELGAASQPPLPSRAALAASSAASPALAPHEGKDEDEPSRTPELVRGLVQFRSGAAST